MIQTISFIHLNTTGSQWMIKKYVEHDKERHVGGSDIQQAPEEANHGVLPQ